MCSLLALPVAAHDFDYTYAGKTLSYTVIDENAKTCMTRPGDFDWFFLENFSGNKVSGDITIPSVALELVYF